MAPTIDGRPNNGTYWKGADGNVYVAGADGVHNAGVFDENTSNYWQPRGYSLQADPNVGNPGAAGSGLVANGTGGGGAANPALNTQAIANTQGTLAQLPDLLARALAENDAKFNENKVANDAQQATQQKAFDTGVVTNQNNYDRNFMSSVGAGVQGLKGLLAILGGAARGTAGDWARETVRGQTAEDIHTGADTQKENQGALETTLNTNLDAISAKRREDENTRLANETAARRDNATQSQDLYTTMAKLYGDSGDTAAANDALVKAGGYTPDIAKYGVAPRANYNTTPAAVTAPSLTAFSGPTQPNVTAPDTGVPGAGLFTISDARKKLAGAVA